MAAAVTPAADRGNRRYIIVLPCKYLNTELRQMRRTKLNLDESHWVNLPELAALSILLWVCVPQYSVAQQPGQKIFSSPEEASDALVTAVRSNNEKAMLDVLGSDAKSLLSSGDEAEDAGNRATFVQRYREMHRLVREPDDTTTLYIGAKNWPTPIPLVHTANSWYFDTDAAKREILYRRIGRNELSTIRICQELVAAENDYRDAGHGEYADRIFSSKGQHDGLYWEAAPAESNSPIGPLLASAIFHDDAGGSKSALTPYRGYYYQLLRRQGKNAPGGAKSYVANGKMTEGFAFVAYPAEYRVSGVMSFIVDGDGVVYERDLGTATSVIAKSIKQYDPDVNWHKAEDVHGLAQEP